MMNDDGDEKVGGGGEWTSPLFGNSNNDKDGASAIKEGFIDSTNSNNNGGGGVSDVWPVQGQKVSK